MGSGARAGRALPDGRSVALGGAKPRALRASSPSCERGRPRDRLIDALWPDRAPGTAAPGLDVRSHASAGRSRPELSYSRGRGAVLEVEEADRAPVRARSGKGGRPAQPVTPPGAQALKRRLRSGATLSRPRLRAVRTRGDRASGRAAALRTRGADRRRARARATRHRRLRARSARRQASATRAAARPADARPLPLRQARGSAARLRRDAQAIGR